MIKAIHLKDFPHLFLNIKALNARVDSMTRRTGFAHVLFTFAYSNSHYKNVSSQ